MKRRHLIEFHEQTWFPATWRKMFLEGLGLAQSKLAVYEHAKVPFTKLIERTGTEKILDLCSGSAGIVMDLVDSLEPEVRPQVVVSDLYPNVAAFETLQERFPDSLSYISESVNAFHPPADAPRVRSIIAALHHFQPQDVRRLLQDTVDNADGIIALESTGRTWLNMLTTLPLPIAAAAICSFRLRPWRVHHLLWGLLIPIVPLVALFDGLVSNIRTYSVLELRELAQSIEADDFVWEVGTVPMPRSPLHATYLIGWRKREAD